MSENKYWGKMRKSCIRNHRESGKHVYRQKDVEMALRIYLISNIDK